MVDIHVNGKEYVVSIDEKNAIGYILALCIPYLTYMSDDAMKQWILSSCEMAEEVNDAKDGSITRKVNSIRDYLGKREFSSEMLQQLIVNLHLSALDMGLMSGFGYGISDGKGGVSRKNINPEFIAIHNYKEKS